MSKRIRSAGVTVGLVLTAGIGFACSAGEPDQEFMDPDYSQVCMEDATELRAPDEDCGDDNGGGARFGYHWMFLGRSHAAPPVGQKLKPGSYSNVRPAGVGSRVPSSGGFGGKIAVGGGG
jgi:hypothetical protein